MVREGGRGRSISRQQVASSIPTPSGTAAAESQKAGEHKRCRLLSLSGSSMWGKAAQGLLVRRLFAPPHAAAPLSGTAAVALRQGCSASSSSSAAANSSSPSKNVSRAPPSPSALVAAGFAPPEGLVFVDRPPPLPEAAPTLLQPRVVIYDGVCHLCHAGVKWVIKADKYKKIKFCCLQSKAAEPYLRLCGLDQEDVLKRFLFVEGLYSYYQASTAALKVAWYLPLPYSALSLFLVIPAPVRDLVYDYVARRRYDLFGKEEECIIMKDKDMLDRFIDRDELLGRDKDKFS